MKEISTRPILFFLIAIAMWITSAALLVVGYSLFKDGKLLLSFTALITAVLLGVFGFIIQVKALSKVFSKMLLEDDGKSTIDARAEDPSNTKPTEIQGNRERNGNNSIAPRTDHSKASLDIKTLDGYTLSYEYNDVKISGCEDYKTQGLQAGEEIVFLHEKEKPEDKNAVSLIVGGVKIGCMNKDRLRDMYHDFVVQNGLVLGRILNHDPLNLTMSILYYKNNTENYEYYDYLKRGEAIKTCMLTSNKSEEMQDNISTCSIGDEVEVAYDYDEETYTAHCFDEIGVFPKSATNFLAHDCKAFVEFIEQNEEDEYEIHVAIFKG